MAATNVRPRLHNTVLFRNIREYMIRRSHINVCTKDVRKDSLRSVTWFDISVFIQEKDRINVTNVIKISHREVIWNNMLSCIVFKNQEFNISVLFVIRITCTWAPLKSTLHPAMLKSTKVRSRVARSTYMTMLVK